MKKLLLLGVAFVFSTLLFAQNTNQNLLSPIGNVGIGTTSPSEKLSVFGNSEMNGWECFRNYRRLKKYFN